MSEPPIPATDHLAARLRARDPQALAEAYALVFASEVGRFVLGDILLEAKVTEPRPRDMAGETRAFMDGAAFVALAIAEKARFDAAALAASLADDTTHQPRGRDDEREPYSGPHTGPDADPDADA